MIPRPPQLPTRILARALTDDPAGPTILGDLHEAWVTRVEETGAFRARIWYTREALALALTHRTHSARSGSGDGTSLNAWLQDARYAGYAVRREMGFTLFTVLIIGLGVGAATAVFSVMSPLMLAPLPLDSPEELVWIASGEGASLSSVTSRTSNLRDFREMNRTFDGMTGYNAFFDQSSYSLTEDGPAEKLMGVGVAQNFLDVLGVEPIYGRNFSEEEGLWDGPRAMILSHGFWIRRFAGDPSIVGRSVMLDGQAMPVIGVLPESFDFASVFTPTKRVDFLMTFAISDETDRWGNTLSMVGRLRPGTTAETAQADLDAVIDGLQTAEPDRWGLGADVTPLQAHISGPFRGSMLLLAASAGTLMLIVCVNLSNMLLARAPRRRREIAVRRTMGATRGRLVRQLLLENLMRAMGGAVVGLAVAVFVTRLVANTSGIRIPMLQTVAVDGTALAFSAFVAIAAGLLVGMIPALQISEGGEAQALRSGSVRAGTGRRGKKVRDLLVVAEVALACSLLFFGGLFLQSFQQVLDVDLGFSPEGTLAWQVTPSRDFENLEEINAHFDQIVATVGEIPGVEAVGLIDALPLGKNRTWGVAIPGEEQLDEPGPSIFPHMVGNGYRGALEIPLVAGRWFDRTDAGDTDHVIVVNASGAEELFPGQDPIGRALLLGQDEWRIVGVVDDVKHLTLEQGSGIQVYFPKQQMWAYGSMDMVVRSNLPATSIASSITAALQTIDPGMPADEYWTLDETISRSASARRFTLMLLGAFGSVALLLAGLGIYGVLSHSVTERIPEIGIRMALGASAQDVRRDVVGRTLILSGIGIGVGVGVALVGSRLIESLLFGVRPADPMTLVGTVSVLLIVAAASGAIPAIRASRIPSATALKA